VECGNEHVVRPNALDRACLRGNIAVVQLLYECASISDAFAKTLRRSPLAMVCKGAGDPELLRKLATSDTWLSHSNESMWFKNNPLQSLTVASAAMHCACESGNLEAVRILLDRGLGVKDPRLLPPTSDPTR
jgi:hypothetical protein